MAGLRKGCCYRLLERPYTRKSKFKSKNYVKAIPNHKIQSFEMGNRNGKFDYKVKLVSRNTLQLRHNAIESARMVVNRQLEKHLGGNYFFKIMIYPHHALRENKMLGGAHADRIQSGMAHSFGKPAGVAAQVKKGKDIFIAYVNKEGVEPAKIAMQNANPRMPGSYLIVVENAAS